MDRMLHSLIPEEWVRQRHRTPRWVPQHPHRHSTARTTLESQQKMGCSPLGGHPFPGDPRVPPPLCPELHRVPPQVRSPHWVLPTRASTHHPASPTPVPFREPPAPRGLPGTPPKATYRGAWAPAKAAGRGDIPLPGIGTHSPLAHVPNNAPKSPWDPTPTHSHQRSREPICKGTHPSRSQTGWAQVAMPIPAGAGQTAAGCPWEEGTATAGWNRSVKKRLLRALSGAS